MTNIKNFTFENLEWNIGDIVEVEDIVDPGVTNKGVIKLIEPDSENSTLFWLYIVANNDLLNYNPDPRIGMFWEILEHTSSRITLISKATVQ